MNAWSRSLLALVATLACASALGCSWFRKSQPGSEDPLPLAKGATWKFRATVTAYNTESARVETKSFDWTTKVLEERYGAGVIGYVISGWPTDIDGQRGAATPSRTMILRAGEFYLFAGGAVGDEEPTLDGAERWFRVPLFDSDAVCPDDGAWSDGVLYCWVVAKDAANPRRYRVSFRSGPDDITYTLEPGRGVVGYHYEHHGTTNTVDLTLISFSPGS